MTQKLTASILLFLMMAVTATSQGRLTYCLCLHAISVGNCACEVNQPCVPGGNPTREADSPDSCDCCDEGAHETAKRTRPVDPVVPCERDCTIDFEFEVSEYSPPAGSSLAVTNPSVTSITDWPEHQRIRTAMALCSRRHGLRAPPDQVLPCAVPLFLKHAVFLV